MRTSKLLLVLFSLLAVFLCALAGWKPAAWQVRAAQADDLVTFIGTLGGAESRAFGINAAGQIVGYASTANGKYHAFLWDGSLHDLGVLPNTSESFAYAINDAGQVVGTSRNLGDVTSRAFRWQSGTLTDLGAFAPRAINKTGDIAGTLPVKRNNLDWYEHACLWRNGTLTDLGTLGGSNSSAFSLNDAGQVVGQSFLAGDQTTHAFVWNSGTLTDLGALGGTNSQALAVSNLNTVSGVAEASATTPGGTPHAFLFTLAANGSVSNRADLGALGSSYSYAHALNSQGQVVGTNGHAVLWQAGAAFDLNALVPAGSGWVLQNATAINENGQITGWGTFQGMTLAFLLPRIAPTLTTSVSAASYNGTRLAPGSIVATFGTNLADTTQVATTSTLPEQLAGTQVLVRDSSGMLRPASLFFVSPGQINLQIPPDAAPGAATLLVSNRTGTLTLGNVTIANVAPGLFTADANGRGLAAAVALRVLADGSQSYESVIRFDSTQNKFVAVPIDLGAATEQVYLLLYGTGVRNRSAQSAVTVKVGGVDAPVSFTDAQGSLTGLDQINALLPRTLAGRGEVEVSLSADGITANAVTISIR